MSFCSLGNSNGIAGILINGILIKTFHFINSQIKHIRQFLLFITVNGLLSH